MRSLRRSRSQIYADFEATISALRRSPVLYLAEPNLKTACTFISGYDAALHGVPLLGFYHWLILKGGGERSHWILNLQRVAHGSAGKSASPERVLDVGCKVLQRFLAYRRRYGVRNLIRDAMALRASQIAKDEASEQLATRRVVSKSTRVKLSR
jgi:hypothetical protein